MEWDITGYNQQSTKSQQKINKVGCLMSKKTNIFNFCFSLSISLIFFISLYIADNLADNLCHVHFTQLCDVAGVIVLP